MKQIINKINNESSLSSSNPTTSHIRRIKLDNKANSAGFGPMSKYQSNKWSQRASALGNLDQVYLRQQLKYKRRHRNRQDKDNRQALLTTAPRAPRKKRDLETDREVPYFNHAKVDLSKEENKNEKRTGTGKPPCVRRKKGLCHRAKG